MNNTTKNLALAAMFIAIGLVLPLLVTMHIPEIGRMLLPMHLPVLFCGLICGRKYGLLVGILIPLMRSFMFGIPVLFPNAIAIAFELATYGFIIGLHWQYFHARNRQNIFTLLISLINAMILGRIVWGTAMALLLGVSGTGVFTWQIFIGGAFFNAIPGIVLQLVLIPLIMLALDRAGLARFNQ
ncbi:MAG: ECF transporter S component [Defluviitaleaceae bacterium]|nr:ECF transporter S component [Defluviitaleaceae bacterium]